MLWSWWNSFQPFGANGRGEVRSCCKFDWINVSVCNSHCVVCFGNARNGGLERKECQICGSSRSCRGVSISVYSGMGYMCKVLHFFNQVITCVLSSYIGLLKYCQDHIYGEMAPSSYCKLKIAAFMPNRTACFSSAPFSNAWINAPQSVSPAPLLLTFDIASAGNTVCSTLESGPPLLLANKTPRGPKVTTTCAKESDLIRPSRFEAACFTCSKSSVVLSPSTDVLDIASSSSSFGNAYDTFLMKLSFSHICFALGTLVGSKNTDAPAFTAFDADSIITRDGAFESISTNSTPERAFTDGVGIC
mmetsp:Transcript_16118/g.24092  ORF Transcript_16118/g.24092 Transcript_16118/m.24092 type:complete len:304 (-) Transcript_16118:1453-2364(-)